LEARFQEWEIVFHLIWVCECFRKLIEVHFQSFVEEFVFKQSFLCLLGRKGFLRSEEEDFQQLKHEALDGNFVIV
jgi:hypothetical protein